MPQSNYKPLLAQIMPWCRTVIEWDVMKWKHLPHYWHICDRHHRSQEKNSDVDVGLCKLLNKQSRARWIRISCWSFNVAVMSWWPSSMTHTRVTRPRWVNSRTADRSGELNCELYRVMPYAHRKRIEINNSIKKTWKSMIRFETSLWLLIANGLVTLREWTSSGSAGEQGTVSVFDKTSFRKVS